LKLEELPDSSLASSGPPGRHREHAPAPQLGHDFLHDSSARRNSCHRLVAPRFQILRHLWLTLRILTSGLIESLVFTRQKLDERQSGETGFGSLRQSDWSWSSRRFYRLGNGSILEMDPKSLPRRPERKVCDRPTTSRGQAVSRRLGLSRASRIATEESVAPKASANGRILSSSRFPSHRRRSPPSSEIALR
jgi:hypothetical protein